ncbi:MAG TPA: biopolymer transporter ExbD [Rickettsiales bacterium]|nr:biopolymer transporter ExbD [Rickettsiales bacterium]
MKYCNSFLKRKLRREDSNNYINFAPFVDILFCLLTVFLIASPIMLGGVNIELPKGDAEVIIVKKEPLVVTIKKDGSLLLEKDEIKLNTLANKLSELTLGEKDVKIFVKADKDIFYDRVITVVSAIYNAGFFDVTLVTDLRKM